MSASCRCCQGDQARVDASGRVRMDPDHRLACVSRVPIFRGLPEEDRRRIAARATTRLVPKGEVVQQQGGMPALQIVHSGQVKQSLLAEDGTDTFIVAGGETSGVVVQSLGVTGFHIGPQIAPGVPWVRAVDRPISLALKSGNFGGERFLDEALDALAAGR